MVERKTWHTKFGAKELSSVPSGKNQSARELKLHEWTRLNIGVVSVEIGSPKSRPVTTNPAYVSLAIKTIIIVLFEFVSLFQFKAMRSGWLNLNEVLIPLISNRNAKPATRFGLALVRFIHRLSHLGAMRREQEDQQQRPIAAGFWKLCQMSDQQPIALF